MANKTKLYIFLGFITILAIGIVLIFTCQKKEQQKPLSLRKITQIQDTYAGWPILSSDKKKILYLDLSSKLFRSLDLATGQKENLLNNQFENVFNVAWSSQDKLIVFQNNNEEIKGSLVDLKLQKVTSLDIGNPLNITWSPDGSKYAYVAYTSDSNDEVYVAIAAAAGGILAQTDSIKTYGAPTVLTWQGDNIKLFKTSYLPPESTAQERQNNQSRLFSIDSNHYNVSRINFDTDVSDLVFSGSGKYAAATIDGGANNLFIYENNVKHPINLFVSSLSSLVFDSEEQNAYVLTDDNVKQYQLALYKIDLTNYTASKIKELDLPGANSTSLFLDNILIVDNKLLFTRNNLLYILPI